jgi:hypothetical protein
MASQRTNREGESARDTPTGLCGLDVGKIHSSVSATPQHPKVQNADFDAHAAPEVVGSVAAGGGPRMGVPRHQASIATNGPGSALGNKGCKVFGWL